MFNFSISKNKNLNTTNAGSINKLSDKYDIKLTIASFEYAISSVKSVEKVTIIKISNPTAALDKMTDKKILSFLFPTDVSRET